MAFSFLFWSLVAVQLPVTSKMSLEASVPGCGDVGDEHAHQYSHQCSCLARRSNMSCGYLGKLPLHTGKHRNTFSQGCETALRNEWGLRKTNLNNSWQHLGKEGHAHNYLLNLDSFGDVGEAGLGNAWIEHESGSLSGHPPPLEVIHPWSMGGLCGCRSPPGQGCDLSAAWVRCVCSLNIPWFPPGAWVVVSSTQLGRTGLIRRPCAFRWERPLRTFGLWWAS